MSVYTLFGHHFNDDTPLRCCFNSDTPLVLCFNGVTIFGRRYLSGDILLEQYYVSKTPKAK